MTSSKTSLVSVYVMTEERMSFPMGMVVKKHLMLQTVKFYRNSLGGGGLVTVAIELRERMGPAVYEHNAASTFRTGQDPEPIAHSMAVRLINSAVDWIKHKEVL